MNMGSFFGCRNYRFLYTRVRARELYIFLLRGLKNMDELKDQAVNCCIAIYNDCPEHLTHLLPDVMQAAWKVGREAEASSHNKKLQTDGIDARCAECGKFITDPFYCHGCMYNQPTAEL